MNSCTFPWWTRGVRRLTTPSSSIGLEPGLPSSSGSSVSEKLEAKVMARPLNHER